MTTNRPRRAAAAGTAAALIVSALALAAGPAAASANTVWLCKPGQHPDPCTPGLSTIVYSPTSSEPGAYSA
jgi:hypothetical protein